MLLNFKIFHINGPRRVLRPPPIFDPHTHLYLDMNLNLQNCISINQDQSKDMKNLFFKVFYYFRRYPHKI